VGQIEMFNPDMPLDEQIELLPYDPRYEFPKERLKLGNKVFPRTYIYNR